VKGDARRSDEGRKKGEPDAETILKQVQHKVQKHDNRIWFSSFCHYRTRS
jgi:hypothetical protein